MSVCVIGSLNVDWVVRVRRLPARGETLSALELARHVGGKGANQAVAAARAGATTRMLGCIGADDAGEWLADHLRGAGVDVTAVARVAKAPTGQAFITLSDDAQNTVVVVGGANASWRAPRDPHALLGDARVLLAQLEVDRASVGAMFAAAGRGRSRLLNAAPAGPGLEPLIHSCDILIVNETELAQIAGVALAGASLARLRDAGRTLLGGDCRAIVVTLGDQGALTIERERAVHDPPRPVVAIDSVGAGDCFCGVLAASLDANLPLDVGVARANAAAAIAVTRRGAAEAMPTQAEIEAASAARGASAVFGGPAASTGGGGAVKEALR